ncbi:MAG: YD repeat protein, partial [Candidatus Roizmanbacteria bacterium GW2011_GWC2_34_23]
MIYLNLKIKKLYFTLKYFLILVLFFLVSVFFVSKVSAQCVPWGYIQCGGNLGTDKCCADAPEGGGHFCVICDSSFLPGTLVKTSTGDKKIENIKVGDEVLSFKDKKIAYSKVVRVFKYPKPYHYTLEAGEYMVKVTYNHPFYIGSNQFKIVEELKIGDTVFVLENNQLTAKEITRKTRVEEESYVYNMTVDNTNTYFAGGFAVHNKGNFECNDRWVNCPAGYIRT